MRGALSDHLDDALRVSSQCLVRSPLGGRWHFCWLAGNSMDGDGRPAVALDGVPNPIALQHKHLAGLGSGARQFADFFVG